jgi:hypothetical protein
MSRSEYDNPNNMMPGAVRVGGVNTPSRPASGNTNPNLMRTPTSSVGSRGTYNSSPSHNNGAPSSLPMASTSANNAIPSRVSNSQPNSARSSPSTADRGRNVPNPSGSSSRPQQQTSPYPGGGGYPPQQQFYGQQHQQPFYGQQQPQQQQQFRSGNLSPNSSQYNMRRVPSMHNSPGFGTPGNDMADIHPADLQMLLGMGFSQSQAVHALRTKNYNVNAAAEYLLES